jgi:hypothetical protein
MVRAPRILAYKDGIIQDTPVKVRGGVEGKLVTILDGVWRPS